jgi:hypothetical protein
MAGQASGETLWAGTRHYKDKSKRKAPLDPLDQAAL